MKSLPLLGLLLIMSVAPVHADDAKSTGQVPAGSTGAITPAQGVTSSKSKKTDKILDHALTPQTRQTLQEAMDSTTPPPASGH